MFNIFNKKDKTKDFVNSVINSDIGTIIPAEMTFCGIQKKIYVFTEETLSEFGKKGFLMLDGEIIKISDNKTRIKWLKSQKSKKE